MKLFEKRPDLHQAAQVFQQENCPPETIYNNGILFLLAIYGAPKTEKSIDNYRYLQFAKSTRLNVPVKLSSLPPTAAAAQHLLRVYYQVQTWLGKNLDPQQWGWIVRNNFLEPITTLLPPAPDVLLNTIFCNCAKGCGANCGCRKIGLKCSAVCGHCHGQSCFNAASRETFDTDASALDTDNDVNPIDILSANLTELEENDDELEPNIDDFQDMHDEDESKN